MSIRKSPPTSTVGYPSPEFDPLSFDTSIEQKGYDCAVEKAIECPCRGGNENYPLASCMNCGGIGWVFINPTQMKVLITGVNSNTKYKAWSQELMGTISATFRDIDRASFMDRITLMDEEAVISEVKKVRTIEEGGNNKNFIFTSYFIEDIEDVFIFQGESESLIRLTEEDYSINPDNPYSILITDEALALSTNNTISIRYKHKVQFHVLDMPHVVRSSNVTNNQGRVDKVKLPVQYIARLAYYVLKPKIDGTGINLNDYTV